MTEKPTLEKLVKFSTVWISRKRVLHGVKKYDVSGGKIRILTDCGEMITVNNSKCSASARILPSTRYKKSCPNCKLSNDRIKKFTSKDWHTLLIKEIENKPTTGTAQTQEIPIETPEISIPTQDFPDPGPQDVEDPTSEFYTSLPEVLTELGKGIGQAQRELDLYAIDVQNTILKDKQLADYGLNATWYTMPEICFDLKMEYSITEIRKEEGEKLIRKLYIMPSNAKYESMFQLNRKEESALSIKFRPTPPPSFNIIRTEVPNLYGMTKLEAKAVLADAEIDAIFVDNTEQDIEDSKTKVIHQTVKPGDFLLEGDKLTVTVESKP